MASCCPPGPAPGWLRLDPLLRRSGHSLDLSLVLSNTALPALPCTVLCWNFLWDCNIFGWSSILIYHLFIKKTNCSLVCDCLALGFPCWWHLRERAPRLVHVWIPTLLGIHWLNDWRPHCVSLTWVAEGISMMRERNSRVLPWRSLQSERHWRQRQTIACWAASVRGRCLHNDRQKRVQRQIEWPEHLQIED